MAGESRMRKRSGGDSTDATAAAHTYRPPEREDLQHLLVRNVPRATISSLKAFAKEDARTTNWLIIDILKQYVDRRRRAAAEGGA